MGLGIIGTMTGPLLIVLHTMPRAIFCGVFFVVGWGSIESNGITKKLLFLMSERRFVQQAEPLLRCHSPSCNFTDYCSNRLPSTGLRTDSLPLEDDAEVVHCERTRDYGRLDSKQ